MSKFSEFIRTATPEEKERVYTRVMKKVAEEQAKYVRNPPPTRYIGERDGT